MLIRTLGLAMIVACLGTFPANAEELRVGTAVTDITPPVPFRMSGYFNERLSTGVRDPLRAKAIVFAQGEVKAALVGCDIIGITLEVSESARKTASEKTGIPVENIAVFATHSHTGPLYAGAIRKHFHDLAVKEHGRDPHEKIDYSQFFADRLVEAIVEADKKTKPMQLQIASAEQEPTISFNRRFHMKEGPVRFNPGQMNPNIVKVAGPIDPEVSVLSFVEPESGKPAGALTVFALHLDTLGGTHYSADYPYYLEQRLQEEYGEDFVSVFGAGTCGDINHVDVTVRGRRPTEEIGNLLADTVLKTKTASQPVKASLAVLSENVGAPLQKYSREEVAKAAELLPLLADSNVPFLERVHAYKVMALELIDRDSLPIEVQAFRLGEDLAVVTLPGEVFVELGLAIKRESPFKNTLVIELANDSPGYIPTSKAFEEGSYETVNSRVRPGGGEAMMAVAIRLLKELKPTP